MHFRGVGGGAGPADVNLATLDGLVGDYLESTLSQASNPQHPSRRCGELKAALLAGRIDEGLQLLQHVCPAALKDQRLVFRLRKQKFVELLRAPAGSGDAQSGTDGAAILCAREELAPMALNAYPEAYPELKRLLLLLLHPAIPASSDAGGLWSQQAKQELADIVYYTVRSLLDVQEPTFPLLMRYLLHLHLTAVAPSQQQQQQSAAALLLELMPPRPRDPAPLPVEHYPRGFPEGDVQAVIQGTGTLRHAAVDALRHADGSALLAFKRELSRIRINSGPLLDLALEYASHRALLTPQQRAELLQLRQTVPELGGSSKTTGGSGRKAGGDVCMVSPGGDEEEEDDEEEGEAGQEGAAGPSGRGSEGLASTPGAGCERRSGGSGRGHGGNGHVASTAGQQATPSVRQSAQQPGRTDSASPPLKVARRMHSAGGAGSGFASSSLDARMAAAEGSGGGGGGGEQAGGSVPSTSAPGGGAAASREGAAAAGLCARDADEALLRLHHLAAAGDAVGVEAIAGLVDPGLFEAQPALLFDLKRCQYAQLLRAGDLTGALSLARTELTPLANKSPELLPLLKATMSALLPGSEAVQQLPALPAVASAVHAVLQGRLGLQGPRLVKLLQVLLASHRAWMKNEKYSDPFQAAMKIDALRAGAASALGAVLAEGVPAGGGLPALERDEGAELDEAGGMMEEEDDEEEGDGSMEVDEDGVLRLMEILELQRGAAIELLQQHDNDVEAAVMSVLR